MEQEEQIKKAYVEHVLENGTRPPSVYAFAKKLALTEEAFYGSYNSFDAIEKDVWKGFFDTTLAKAEGEEVYAQYSVREKLLSFYYTLVEVLKANRSFVILTQTRFDPRAAATSRHLVAFKHAFLTYTRELLAEGTESREVVPRPFLSDRYPDGLWVQLMFVLNFWIRDDSKGFEKTDVAIEKAVNTSFELIGRLPVDAVADFVKFLLQNRSN